MLASTQKRRYIRATLKNPFEVLTIVTKSSILDVTGFVDLCSVIEKIDLSFVSRFVLLDC